MKAAILLRDFGGTRLVFSVFTLLATGALASFMVIYLTFIPFDRTYFYLGMNYQSRATTDHPNGAESVHSGATIGVSPDSPEASSGIYLHSRHLSLMQPEDSDSFEKALATSLISGEISGDGVAIDEATLAGWGLEVGDRIIVQDEDLSDSPCITVVTGATRPFNTDSGDLGLVVIPKGTCTAQVLAAFAQHPGVWETYGGPGPASSSNFADAARALTTTVTFSSLVWVVAILAGGLWLLMLWRIAMHLDSHGAPSALTLVAIGASPTQLSHAAMWIFTAIAAVAAAGAVVVAKATLMASVTFYAQPFLTGVVALAMLATAILAGGFHFRGWPLTTRRLRQKGAL